MHANWRIRLGVLSAAIIGSAGPALAQSAWITYQGQLKQSGTLVNGTVNIVARLFDAQEGGTLLGQQGLFGTPVEDGLFNVILNTGAEFGPSAFDSDQRWLEFEVDGHTLSPRQKLTAAPFAASAYSLHMPAGAGIGKVLTSDANGLGTWQSPSGGPWLASGPNIFFNAGSVGIGTSSPHANFKAQLSGGAGAWKGGLAAGGGSANVVLGELNSVATIGGHNATLGAWANLALNVGGGFVGIGTSNPTWPLHIIPDASNRGLRVGRNDPGSPSVNIGVSDTDGLPFIQSAESEGTNYGTLSLNPFGGIVKVRSLVITGGSDIAEPYDIASSGPDPQPGMVVCIDSDAVGKLRLSSKAYDHAVAGVISGANGVNPGVILTQKDTAADGQHPVAMNGRVWCCCDADAAGPIHAGDLLTTSDTAGHAMRVAESRNGNGAIIGKAMSGLTQGKGLVLVLVSLQ